MDDQGHAWLTRNIPKSSPSHGFVAAQCRCFSAFLVPRRYSAFLQLTFYHYDVKVRRFELNIELRNHNIAGDILISHVKYTTCK